MDIDMDAYDALRRVEDYLNHRYALEDDKIVVVPETTLTKPYGWVFFYNSKRHLETGDIMYALGGNGPVVFEIEGGVITELGTASPPDEEIRRYEGSQRSQKK